MSAVTPERTFQSSELSRNSGDVFRAADQGPITVTRRDGEPLLLMRQEDFKRDHDGLELASIFVGSALSAEPVPLHTRLTHPFPWLTFLTSEDQQAFAEEMVNVARACASIARFDQLLVTLAAWRSTAIAVAEGYTPDAQLTWLDEPEPAADPRLP